MAKITFTMKNEKGEDVLYSSKESLLVTIVTILYSMTRSRLKSQKLKNWINS